MTSIELREEQTTKFDIVVEKGFTVYKIIHTIKLYQASSFISL